jgi:hypothetical protein
VGRLLLGFQLLAALGGCIVEDEPTCDADPALNTCSNDEDCVMASCSADCCDAPTAYSARQLGAASCLVALGETASDACADWGVSQCGEVTICLSDPSLKAGCDAGVCVVRTGL